MVGRFKLAAVAAAAAMWGGGASAATVTVSETLDISGPTLPNMHRLFQDLATPVSFTSGDTIDITINFEGDQEIVWTNGNGSSFIGLFSPEHSSSFNLITSTGAISFLDLGGSTLYTTPELTTPDDCCFVGHFFDGHLGSPPTPLRIGGVRYVGVVTFDSEATYEYTRLGYDFSGTYTIEGVAIPEPSAWALMIGGFGLAGAALRRRSGARAASA